MLKFFFRLFIFSYLHRKKEVFEWKNFFFSYSLLFLACLIFFWNLLSLQLQTVNTAETTHFFQAWVRETRKFWKIILTAANLAILVTIAQNYGEILILKSRTRIWYFSGHCKEDRCGQNGECLEGCENGWKTETGNGNGTVADCSVPICVANCDGPAGYF